MCGPSARAERIQRQVTIQELADVRHLLFGDEVLFLESLTLQLFIHRLKYPATRKNSGRAEARLEVAARSVNVTI